MNTKENIIAFGVRSPEPVLNWIREQAAKEERSANWFINRLLREAMEAQQKEEAA